MNKQQAGKQEKSGPPKWRKDRLPSMLKGSQVATDSQVSTCSQIAPGWLTPRPPTTLFPKARRHSEELQQVRMTSTLAPSPPIGSDPSGSDSSSSRQDTLIYSQDTLRPRAVMHSSDSTTPFIQHTSPIYPASTTSFANSTPFT